MNKSFITIKDRPPQFLFDLRKITYSLLAILSRCVVFLKHNYIPLPSAIGSTVWLYINAATFSIFLVFWSLKGLGHEIEFKYFDKNGYI